MKRPDYPEQLRDPRWQRKRLEVMQRDNWTCQRCSRDDITLNVHHKKYIDGRMPWEYDEELVTLCQPCHGIVSPGWLCDRLQNGTANQSNLWTLTALQLLTTQPQEAEYVCDRMKLYHCSPDARRLARLYQQYTPDQVAMNRKVGRRVLWLNQFCCETAPHNIRLRPGVRSFAHSDAWVFTLNAAEAIGEFSADLEAARV